MKYFRNYSGPYASISIGVGTGAGIENGISIEHPRDQNSGGLSGQVDSNANSNSDPAF
jgi:hypothetical protein